MILRWLTPAYYATSVVGVDPQRLFREGIRGIVLDLDNTVVAWNAPAPTEAVRKWVNQLRHSGLKACIVSNNFRGRPRAIAEMLGIPVVVAAVKPIPWALRRAMGIMGTPARQTALIGDQVFTDILGGNLVGMYTILVDPLSSQEFPTTKLVRRLERLVRARVISRTPAR
ncbi:MAG TPA: YqeG family HAD IIIA-type phosphatase [bacterium]|nr:YqeG family HAD IIIA-type phosphatase [bacterium]